jgi:hypothetical protein
MGIDLDVSRRDHVRLLRTFDHSAACPRGHRRQGAWFRARRQCRAGRFRLAGDRGWSVMAQGRQTTPPPA